MIIGGVIIGIIVLFILIFTFVSMTSKKLVCKSKEGNITIMYDEKKLKGYTTKGLTYDFEGQKEYANQIGTDAYIEAFKLWFETNTTGTCK